MDPNQFLKNENLGGLTPKEITPLPEKIKGKISQESWMRLTDEQRFILSNLDILPDKLVGVVPGSVWSGLSVDQRLEFLLTHEIIPKVILTAEFVEPNEQPTGIETKASEESFTQSVESSFDQGEFEKLRDEVHQIEQMSKEEESDISDAAYMRQQMEAPLTAEEIARIEAEKGPSFPHSPLPTVAGYQIDEEILQNMDEYAEEDPVRARTWSANILRKFLFSTDPE